MTALGQEIEDLKEEIKHLGAEKAGGAADKEIYETRIDALVTGKGEIEHQLKKSQEAIQQLAEELLNASHSGDNHAELTAQNPSYIALERHCHEARQARDEQIEENAGLNMCIQERQETMRTGGRNIGVGKQHPSSKVLQQQSLESRAATAAAETRTSSLRTANHRQAQAIIGLRRELQEIRNAAALGSGMVHPPPNDDLYEEDTPEPFDNPGAGYSPPDDIESPGQNVDDRDEITQTCGSNTTKTKFESRSGTKILLQNVIRAEI